MTNNWQKLRLLFLALCLGAIFPSSCFAQSNAKEALKELNLSKSSLQTRKCLIQIKDDLIPENYATYEEIEPIIQKFLIATNNKSEEEQLFAQITLLRIKMRYFNKLEHRVALEAYQKAKHKKYRLAVADAAITMGQSLMYSSNKGKALSYVLEASQIYEELGMLEETSEGYYQACMINYWGANIDKAELYYKKLIALGLSSLRTRNQINTINTGGLIAKRRKLYDLAIKKFREAIALARSYGDSVWVGIANGNIGDVYCDMELYEMAKPYLLNDLEFSTKHRVFGNVIITLNQLGDIATIERKHQSAYNYYLKAAQTIENEKGTFAPKDILRTYQNLASNSRTLGNHIKAYDYLTKSTFWQDSLYEVNKEAEILEIQAGFDYDHKEKELDALKKEKELAKKNQELKVNIALTGSIIMAFIIFYIWRSYRKQKSLNSLLQIRNNEIIKQKKQIEDQTTALHTQNKELKKREGVFRELLNALAEDEQKIKTQNERLRFDKEKLMEQVTHRTHELVVKNKELQQNNTQLEQFNYVIAHNIRGPVARLLGLFQLYENTNDEEERNMLWSKITHSANDIDTVIKDLNTTLLIKNNVNEVYEEINLVELTKKVLQTLQVEIDESHAQFNINLSITHVNSVKAYIESILYNLVSNAIKYRNQRRPLRVDITTQEINNRTVLIVNDNGLGIDLEKYHEKLFGMYKRFHIHQDGKGLGLHLVKLQVESLGGHIAVESTLDEGTTFRVYL